MTHSVPTLALPDRPPADPMPPMDPAMLFPHVAHELRQPLSAMESIAYYLEMVLPPGEGKARLHLPKLRLLIEQTNGILSDAMRLLHAPDCRLELMDLNEVVGGFVPELRAYERVNVALTLADDLPLLRLDPSQAQHLLENLFRLVRRLLPAGEVILARTSSRDGQVSLLLTFPAPGCDATELQMFLDRPEAHLSAGYGLTLASIRQILDAHEGRIQVQPDVGVRVSLTVVLPSAT